MLEVLLMAALADGDLTPDEYDRIGRAMRDHPGLAGIDWDLVVHRAGQLAEDAPLFFETRQALPLRIAEPDERRRAIALAARVVGAERPLVDEERAVLTSVADTFEIPESELQALLGPSESAPASGSNHLGFVRCDFNAPDDPAHRDLFTALRAAEDDEQRRLVLFKLTAARHVQWRLSAEGPVELLKTGERLRFGPDVFRVDALFERSGTRILARFLSSDEALHRREHAILKVLADRLPETASLLVAHEGPLSPEDRSFVEGFDPHRLWTVPLSFDALRAEETTEAPRSR